MFEIQCPFYWCQMHHDSDVRHGGGWCRLSKNGMLVHVISWKAHMENKSTEKERKRIRK